MTPPDPLREQWARHIRFTRKHHKLTQVGFAKLFNVTNQTVSDWERAVKLPGPKYRADLMRMYALAKAEQIEKENGAAV